MYVIEISEDKLHCMAEHVEHGLRHMGKLMQCIEDLKEEFEDDGAYGERGRLSKESEDGDWWEDEDRKYKHKDRYGKPIRRY